MGKQRPNVYDLIREQVDPKAYYDWAIPEKVHWPFTEGSEPRVNCVFHKDNATPSLHVNPVNGKFYCHGCEASGNGIVTFHAKLNDLPKSDAAEEIYHEFVHPLVYTTEINDWHDRLIDTPSAMNYLLKRRGLSREVVDRLRLGFDGERITIPVRNEYGYYVNVKLHDPREPRPKGSPKMLNYKRDDEKRRFGPPAQIYPIGVLLGENPPKRVVLCEGEYDALLLLSLGVPAVTMTAGVKSWNDSQTELFRGLDVVIAYDNDTEGNRYARKIPLRKLMKVALKVRRLEIPELSLPDARDADKKSKDVTDWWRIDDAMRSKGAWISAIKKAPVLVENPPEAIVKAEGQRLTLDQASSAEHYHKPIHVQAIITGKLDPPYILPKTFRVSCSKACDACPLNETGKEFVERKVDPSDPKCLQLVDCDESGLKRVMVAMAGLGHTPKCQAKPDVIDTFNLENVVLIPTLNQASKYVMRAGYFVGHGLRANRAYEFQGVTTAHPIDQRSTHLFTSAQPVQDEVETFRMTPQLVERLKIFRPPGKLSVLAQMMAIAEWQSRNVTKILERPDLHIAVDLVFHSVAAFDFNGEFVKRGMLDVLVIGDTRCGKGYVSEGLCGYYGLGEIASAENCTFAGLIGGAQQVGKRWLITWGIVPLNDGRLVVIDEASALPESEIGRMSRVRSEGIAEVNKIVRESTRANTRLLWNANCRSGRSVREHDHGPQAIKQLIGANEDISRFDFALTVATDEVDSEIINTRHPYSQPDSDKYPAESCRALVLWAWSRSPDQVKFTESATTAIIKQAIQFGRTYSSSIPLVQAENIRIKLAKISVAVAARVFSADETGERIVVNERHVAAACEYLHLIYSKPSMRYDDFSKRAIASTKIDVQGVNGQSIGGVPKAIEDLGVQRTNGVRGLLSLHRVTADGLADYVGDELLAKTLIGDLVKLNCLVRYDNWYLKNPTFSAWLRTQTISIHSREKASLE